MKQNKFNSGNLHIAVIFILIIICALGYYFSQNFFKIKSTTKDNSMTSSLYSTSETTPINMQILTITEWGIKGSYTSSKELKQSLTNGDPSSNRLFFYSDDVIGICDDSQSDGYTGVAIRYNGDDLVSFWGGSATGDVTASYLFENQSYIENGNNTYIIKHINDYYIFFTAGNNNPNPCFFSSVASDPDGSKSKALQETINEVKQFAQSVEAI